MNDEMILVPRAELLAWAKAWLYEYGPHDGTDCVTPFDTYLLKSPAEAEHFRSVAEMVAALNPDAGEIGAGMLRHLVGAARRALAAQPGGES